MTEHDVAVLAQVRVGGPSAVVDADDPAAVAAALVGHGARSLPAEEVAAWTAEAQMLRGLADDVLAAERVVADTRAHERARRQALLAAGDRWSTPASAPPSPSPAGEPDDVEDGPAADRAAIRFSLVILALAQLGGVAVYVADGLLLAVVLPAVALVGVAAVAIAHRAAPPEPPPRDRAPQPGAIADRPRPDDDRGRGDVPIGPAPLLESPAGVPAPPVVRAAEAHLRRRQAAWKLAWWERGLSPVDVATWVGATPGQAPATLVVVDDHRVVPDQVLDAMTAAVPAAVRVVVLRRRR